MVSSDNKVQTSHTLPPVIWSADHRSSGQLIITTDSSLSTQTNGYQALWVLSMLATTAQKKTLSTR